MFFLSWRQLVSRKKQTILILLGISFGTLLFVSISGVQLGMRAFISDQLLNNTSHVLISGAERTVDPKEVRDFFYANSLVKWVTPPSGLREEVRLENYGGWYQRLSSDPNVVDFSPRLAAQAIASNGKFSVSLNLIGLIPERQMRISAITSYMQEGSFGALQGSTNTIVIGSEAAIKLGTRVDHYLRLSTGQGEQKLFKVVGIMHLGNKQVDESLAFANLNDVQVLAKTPGRVSQIAVALYDIEKSTEVASQWRALSKDKVQDWQEANQTFMQVIKVQDFTRYFITVSILIVAAFGVYNVLSIMINQKKREIAILRAIGYGPQKILLLILYQGLLLGIGGGVLGIILGYALCQWIAHLDLAIEFHGSHHMPVSFDWRIYVTALITANISALIASIIPAHFASRLTPIDIIRSES